MKKKLFLAGMTALALAFVVVLGGCPAEPPDDSREAAGVTSTTEAVAG
jgi:hypothetical protein